MKVSSQAMKAYGDSGGIASLILTSALHGVNGQRYSSLTLLSRKSFPVQVKQTCKSYNKLLH
jgi:hypothetical protein